MVYDGNVGSRTWSVCTDSTTGADKIACFANSASFLSLLAPGGLITDGGYSMAGTSQASPHVTGAVAVLASGRSDMTPDQISERLVATGDAVIDTRNGLTFPRLNLFAALGAGNDLCTVQRRRWPAPTPSPTLMASEKK